MSLYSVALRFQEAKTMRNSPRSEAHNVSTDFWPHSVNETNVCKIPNKMTELLLLMQRTVFHYSRHNSFSFDYLIKTLNIIISEFAETKTQYVEHDAGRCMFVLHKYATSSW